MRSANFVLIIALLILLGTGWYLRPIFVTPPYVKFTRRDANYYSQFAVACDRILAGHPLGTNEFISLGAKDASLPKIVQTLEPDLIEVRSNSVCIAVATNTSLRFGIRWEPSDHAKPHLWVLRAVGESGPQQLYSQAK
jgi:hypothetical protein